MQNHISVSYHQEAVLFEAVKRVQNSERKELSEEMMLE